MKTTLPSPFDRFRTTSIPSISIRGLFFVLILLLPLLAPSAALAQAVAIGGKFAISESSLCPGKPAIAMAPDGENLVVWTDGSEQSIYGRRFDASGSALGGEQILHSGSTLSAPSVGRADNGDYVVVWAVGSAGGPAKIEARLFSSTLVPIGSLLTLSNTTNENFRPRVAVEPDGDFVVVWERRDGDSIEARRFTSNGTPAANQFTVASQSSGFPNVDMEPDGDSFVISWEENLTGTNANIRARKYTADGTAVGNPFLANIFTTGDQVVPSVAMAANSLFLVGWEGATNTNTAAAVVGLLDANLAHVGEIEVGSGQPTQTTVDVALSNDGGKFAAAFVDTPPPVSAKGLFSESINASVNNYFNFIVAAPGSRKMNPSVALDDRERGLIVWQDDPEDDGCFNIVGQRFQTFENLDLDALPLTATVHSISQQGAWKYYVLTPPIAATILVTMYPVLPNLNHDKDLYVRFGNFPDLTNYNCRSFLSGGAAETCTLDSTGAPLLIGINGYEAGSGPFNLDVAFIPAVFVDGFESGDTSAWSAVIP